MQRNRAAASEQPTCRQRSTGNGRGITPTTRDGTTVLAGHFKACRFWPRPETEPVCSESTAAAAYHLTHHPKKRHSKQPSAPNGG
jgi:hypothetical protein